MCKINTIKRIVPAMMLYENIKDKLNNDGILRPIARDSDEIWQQMKLENFDRLINNKSLYMKAHAEYSDYEERKIQNYIETCYTTTDEKKNSLLDELEKLEKQIYISCWYSSSDLSDVVFKQYSDDGIAIGTDVETLINCIDSSIQGASDPDAKKYNCFAGNVQYIYHKEFTEDNIFENTQIICPIFLKGMQFKADNEFRLCILKNSTDTQDDTDLLNYYKINYYKKNIFDNIKHIITHNIQNTENISSVLIRADDVVKKISSKSNVKFLALKDIDFQKLIKRVAFKNDGIYSILDDNALKQFVNSKISKIGLKVGNDIKRIDGFIKIELEAF